MSVRFPQLLQISGLVWFELLSEACCGQCGREGSADEVCRCPLRRPQPAAPSHALPAASCQVHLTHPTHLPPACFSCYPWPVGRVLLETPGEYRALEEYFKHCSASSPVSPGKPVPSLSPVICDSSEVGPLSVSGVPGYATGAVHPLQDTLPTSAVSELLQEFGPNVFVLWKLALLQKRILFCSSPPIGRTCLLGELNKSNTCSHLARCG